MLMQLNNNICDSVMCTNPFVVILPSLGGAWPRFRGVPWDRIIQLFQCMSRLLFFMYMEALLANRHQILIQLLGLMQHFARVQRCDPSGQDSGWHRSSLRLHRMSHITFSIITVTVVMAAVAVAAHYFQEYCTI